MRVLFVCVGNTCRSVFAEYLANHRFRAHIEAASAGIRPGSVEDAENAVYTLKQYGIDASGHRPLDVREVNLREYDLIVAMEPAVAKSLGQLFPALSSDRIRKWRIRDPYGDDLAEYEHCASAIHRELRWMLS
jgi:arsenate reductase (thioredoxin)